MGMINPVDALLSFGEAAYSANPAALPNVIDVNAAQTERMKAEVQCTVDFAGGTSIALKLQGSDNNSDFTEVAGKTIALAALKAGANFTLPIPDGVNYRYYKVTFAETGTFTAGKLTGYLDTYLGI